MRLYHFFMFGAIGYILTALYTGGTLHPMLTFDAVKALQIISRERGPFLAESQRC